VKITRPSGPTLVTCVLLVLLPALAVLQYRWVGQVSVAERERMQRNLRNAAGQFRESFEGELARALFSLTVGPATAQAGGSDQYSNRYDTWVNTAAHPQVVAGILLIDADGGALRLRRFNDETHAFEPTAWPENLSRLQPEFEQELAAFSAGRPFDGRRAFRQDQTLVVTPLRNLVTPRGPGPGPQTVTPVFGFTVVQLNMEYIRETLWPELAQRHFSPADPDGYRVAVTDTEEPANALYRSDPDATVLLDQADAAVPLTAGRIDFVFGRGNPRGQNAPGREVRRGETPDAGAAGDRAEDTRGAGRLRAGSPDDVGRWRLLLQHRSGSLEAAVAGVRRRNLAISFGVLLLLTVSVALLTATTRRAHRLARQQMEFVAGVSHELRTPVAVIRSAAENLSQGVVSGDRVKRYGQMLEGEARRLGEMVERVLQYAGVESGLGLGPRAPLAPADIIDTAIASSQPMLAAENVNLHRDIAADLPPVVGDAAALQSAVQNLIANAVKYGGADHWVGIRAEHVRERRRSEVRITVSDHGRGIPPSELPQIFEPFYRGSDALARQVHGNGLGLSLVKRIVISHGGRVNVATRTGGSSFTISLPAAAADARPSAIAGEQLLAGRQ
jgi:signal transduction histidine kinase